MPVNRVVAFAGPVISVLAAAVAAWVVARANVLGIEGLDEANVATQAAAALTFVLVATLTWLGQSKWLTGVHVAMRADNLLATAALTATAPSFDPQVATPPPPGPPVAVAPTFDAQVVAAPAPPPPAPPVAGMPVPASPPPSVEPPGDLEGGGGQLTSTVIDVALPGDVDSPAEATPAQAPAAEPDGIPDALRPVMPSEEPLQGEPDEAGEP
jgi:hypothetical protein